MKNFGRKLNKAGCFIMMLIFAFASQEASARSIKDEFAPRAVVSKYCRLDLEGARLSSQNIENSKISDLVGWAIEPGWDTVVVVRDCNIVNSTIESNKAHVTVRYTLIGNLFGETITTSQKREEFVTFFLTRVHDSWRIERPMIAPHISIPAAISELKNLLIDETDPEQIRRLKSGIEAIKHLNP